jgi:hypothetical protein
MEFVRKFATDAEHVLDVDSVSSVIAKAQQTKAASMSPPLSNTPACLVAATAPVLLRRLQAGSAPSAAAPRLTTDAAG